MKPTAEQVKERVKGSYDVTVTDDGLYTIRWKWEPYTSADQMVRDLKDKIPAAVVINYAQYFADIDESKSFDENPHYWAKFRIS